jgi:hypothetical protein
MPTERPDRRAMAVAVLWQGSAMPARPPARRLEWDQVLGWRLRRHHLDQRAPSGELLAVVAEIAGLHAQVMSSAELTLWTRVDGLDRQAVHDALWRDRNLVKTWAMRGTLHLLPAAEYPLWQAALSTRRGYERGSWQRGFGVTLEQLQTMHGAIRQALDGQVLSREAIAEASAAPSVRLLPAFDQYVVAATRHAEQLMPGPFKDRVYRPQGWLSPVLLAGGRMLGTWRQEPKGRRLMVTIEPFAKLPAAVRRRAEHEAERLATWTGATLELAWAGTPD